MKNYAIFNSKKYFYKCCYTYNKQIIYLKKVYKNMKNDYNNIVIFSVKNI